MSTQLTPEQRKERTELIVKVAGLLGVCLVLGPLATTIAAGLGALAALAVGAAGIFTVWKFLPWFAMKIGNARLKAIKAEAMKNPCETLQNQYVQKERALADYKTNIARFAAQVMAFVDLETGDVWVHRSRLNQKRLPKNNYTFFRADREAIRALVAVTILNVSSELKELK